MGRVVSATPWSLYHGKRDPMSILWKSVCAARLVWTRSENVTLTGIRVRYPAPQIWEGITCEYINLLTPNVNCSGRTAPLTSKVAFYIFIQQI